MGTYMLLARIHRKWIGRITMRMEEPMGPLLEVLREVTIFKFDQRRRQVGAGIDGIANRLGRGAAIYIATAWAFDGHCNGGRECER